MIESIMVVLLVVVAIVGFLIGKFDDQIRENISGRCRCRAVRDTAAFYKRPGELSKCYDCGRRWVLKGYHTEGDRGQNLYFTPLRWYHLKLKKRIR